jgi:hypothetical protein
VAEDIIILPTLGGINFYDTGNTVTTFTVFSDRLAWRALDPSLGSIDWLTWQVNNPSFVVNVADLKIVGGLRNDALSPLIDSTGWKGNRLPQGAQGSQGAKGLSGSTG